VYREDTLISLQNNEFELLEFLMRNAGRVITKTEILEKVWNYSFDPQTNIVDVLVWRLRSKIDRHFGSKLIQTVRGVGYTFRPI
jgi:DNA-binding response OmpR family regulator